MHRTLFTALAAALTLAACISTAPRDADPADHRKTESRLVVLEHVEANDMVATLEQLAPDAGADGVEPMMQFAADDETNSVILVATPSRLDELMALINRLDHPQF